MNVVKGFMKEKGNNGQIRGEARSRGEEDRCLSEGGEGLVHKTTVREGAIFFCCFVFM